MEEDIVLVCGEYGQKIGDLVQMNNRTWLQVGEHKLSYGHGPCGRCNHLWHWNSNEMRLKRLVTR
jgi:hypothetical protein